MYPITAAYLAAALLLAASPSLADSIPGNTANQSFNNKAKKILLREVYPDHRVTFYCGSEFNDQGKIAAHTGGYQPKKEGKRGSCDMEIEDRKAEPPPRYVGIARTYWDKGDPVDAWECKRGKRVEALQGNENPFVKGTCIEKGFW